MVSTFKAAWLPLWAVAGLQLACAQAQPPAAAGGNTATRADPADAAARVPAATYRSPFATYPPSADTPLAPWRDTNDRVRQRGGWRAYAREATEPDAARSNAPAASSAAPSAVPRAAPPAASGGHAGHHGMKP